MKELLTAPIKGTTLQLDIPVLLPDAPDAADACAVRLLAELTGRDGVTWVHVLAADGDQPAKLCIHYDPDMVSLGRIKEIAEGVGAQVTQRFGHVLWQLEGITSAGRARTVTDYLLGQPGVQEAAVSAGGAVRVEFDRTLATEPDLLLALDGIGEHLEGAAGHAHDATGDDHDHDRGGILGEKSEIIFAGISGALLVMGTALPFVSEVPSWLPLWIFIAAYVFGGYYLLREAIDNLRMRRLEIDALMLVAAAGAAVLGKWAEGALLLVLFSLGHALEHYAMDRARKAISALADLAPPTAEVRRAGAVSQVPVGELTAGDTVIIRPNSRIPADGFVTLGHSSVDQAPITGESVPVDKVAVADIALATTRPQTVTDENRVFAGTINGSGALEVQVTRRAADSTLARLVSMVAEAETQKSPTQRFTDRFERVFVPVVLSSVFLLLFAFLVIDEPFGDSFYRAMAVLVAASPCALAIATPSAVLSGIARAARGGVLVKGGGPLERLGSLKAIAFDKTGTLTVSKPELIDAIPAADMTERDLLTVAIALEQLSNHPLAAAVVRNGLMRLGAGADIPPAQDLRSITGNGLAARYEGEDVFLGKPGLFDQLDGSPIPNDLRATAARLEDQGRTTVVLRRGAQYLGVLGLMDQPRPEAASVIARLRRIGITRMIMISGDNQRVVDAVARTVGLDEAVGNLMPEDKVAEIKRLRAENPVAMVGDGVNDAPAMAHATVGIAMGAAGSDVALETADVALMGDDLGRLPFAIGLSRATSRIIRQNLWISLGMVAVLVPATLFGLQLGAAVVFHEGSTLLVVANALRLLVWKDRTASNEDRGSLGATVSSRA
ncbi:heavy metal translocating P-type ATPase [Pseudotabrizicola sediminis]|uniref:Heavy metal translocating P-type ATPase n=1 Tax=Pseudotabrizicola sediminis TaxID=2486418 RepID=A0ABY2KHE1_9RHOB|nr:heavy metal translocating P-type ATPase [Pseudotabrizicola sediminis]TGD41693.1 heavy metal translocating P-type ATPase [Pseudotabrizicola sediminis]